MLNLLSIFSFVFCKVDIFIRQKFCNKFSVQPRVAPRCARSLFVLVKFVKSKPFFLLRKNSISRQVFLIFPLADILVCPSLINQVTSILFSSVSHFVSIVESI